jgi:hypothetical protein
VNGYLPNTEDEWVDILSSLIKTKSSGKELAQAGQTVIDKYSWKPGTKIS